MDTTNKIGMDTKEKVALFRSLFSGLPNVYGTYDPDTGRSWQVKKPITYDTILAHLQGKAPYGVYLLNGDRTRAIAVDFDNLNKFAPIEFANRARHYNLPAYIETSKSKGFHVWIFFNEDGVKASKARLVVNNILEEIKNPDTEIFPKQDFINIKTAFGNFINAPLFGKLVHQKKTVFVDPKHFQMYPNQWTFLGSVERVIEDVLDETIEINNLSISDYVHMSSSGSSENRGLSRFSLPPCARKMLRDGVSEYQRVSCFRLAIHFKRMGLPCDISIAALKTWALKNRPIKGKRVITEREIISQTQYAYEHRYSAYGCESPTIKIFCEEDCPFRSSKKFSKTTLKSVIQEQP